MNKTWINVFVLSVVTFLFSACQHAPTPLGKPEKNYDWDHEIYYEQTKFSDTHYFLKIRSDDYAHFTNQSVFLLRHAKKLCQGMNPKLSLQTGIQDFSRLPTTPRAYQPDLQVEVRCGNQ